MNLDKVKAADIDVANYIEEERLNGKFIDIYDFLKRIYKKTNKRII